MPQRLLIVSNPLPNRGRYQLLGWLLHEVKKRGWEWCLCHTQSDFDASINDIKARLDGISRVVGLGGDGTLHLLANCLAGSGIPLAILPCGTGNDFIRTFGHDLEAWKEAVFGMHQRYIDLGRVNDRYFINIAGIGFDAAVVKHMADRKGRLGKLSYLLASLRILAGFRGDKLSLSSDAGQRRYQNLLTVFANGRFFGGGMEVAPAARPDDGRLECYSIEDCAFSYKLIYFPLMFFGRHTGAKIVTHSPLVRARVETPGLDIEADGELIGQTPADITLVPGALLLLLPAG